MDTAVRKSDGFMEHVEEAEKGSQSTPQYDQFGSTAKVDPKEIRLVRKLDAYMMPILWVMYFLNFLDRNAMVNGKLNSLSQDLNLHGTQYNTCVSILFVGYLLGQVPSNMLLNRVKPARYMSGFMMAWAIVSTLTCLVKNYHGMLVCRLILGIVEAPFYPGALFMISLFYNRKEATTRMAVLYTGNMLASAFSGLISAGVFAGLDKKHGLAGWQWLFLIQGVVTIGVAVLAWFILPNSPLQTPWLTPEDRQLAHDRIARDTTQKREGTSTWTGLREASTDYRTWIFALICNLHLSANGFKNFMPTVVKTLGFNDTISLVLTCPPYLVATFTSVAVSWSSGHFNERTWHITISKGLAIIGFAVACGTLNLGARYFAMILFVAATYGVNNINIAWVAATTGQTDEKKAVAIAITNTLGNLASVYTPYLWPDSDAPRFATAMYCSIGFSAGVVILAWVMKAILIRENRKIRATNPEELNLYAY
ncbi:putative MFS transporter [Aspergillus brunneoviolaceus CBS 621.78]|uniref:MFS transporter n=1 Tax=Aspergillus brunneoviolaceus CBS 621.78 TaxID=1450534 RepID=A0ACD1GDK1_9EURO|nr:putative MFS transporter [Aspergillus brunneoviolaceus CBS 621.78]RAH47323.1 putative MFS transporter [Aspergillus brunneoviolaceus CBS 621.78]